MVPLEEKPPSYFSTIFNESDKNLYQNTSNQYPLNPDRLISQSRRIRPVRNTVAPEVSILRPKKLDINQKVILCRIVTLIGSILFAAALAIIIVYGISKINNSYFGKILGDKYLFFFNSSMLIDQVNITIKFGLVYFKYLFIF